MLSNEDLSVDDVILPKESNAVLCQENIDKVEQMHHHSYENEGKQQTIQESPKRKQTSTHRQTESSGEASTKPEPSKPIIRWEHSVIKTAFLEDSAQNIYVRSIKELDPARVLGVSEQNKDFIFDYMYMLKSQSQPAQKVKSIHKIVSIKDVYTKKLINVR